MFPIVTIVVFGLVLAVAFVLAQKIRAQNLAAWRAFAEARGLSCRDDDLSVEGDVDGVAVLLDTFRRRRTDSNGKTSHTTYTRVRATAPNPFRLEVAVYPEHIFSGLGKMLGFQDVATGDPRFDETFVVKASHEDGARVLLNDELRDALQRFQDRVDFEYVDGAVEMSWQGTETDHAILGGALDAVVAAARVSADDMASSAASEEADESDEEEAPKPRRRRRRKAKAEPDAEAAPADDEA